MFGFNAVMLLLVTSSEFFTVRTLFLFSLRLESSRTSSQVSVALPRQLLHVVLRVIGYTTRLRKIRVVLGLRCCLSLLCDLFKIDLLELDDLLGVLC